MKARDSADNRILTEIQEDGRLSNAKLAEAISMSETPTWRRLRKLEEDGYIVSYQANLDRRKMGFGVLAFVQITCIQHDKTATVAFENIILSSPNVLSCHNTTGQDDYLLQVIAANLDDYSAFVEDTLRQLPGVSAIRSNLSMREIKSTTRLPVGSAICKE